MAKKMEKEIIEKYLNAIVRDKFHRYSSWDNCFKSFSEKQSTENHSLQLAFYLASWGMYRGSSGLLQKNYLIHEGAVEIIYKGKYDQLRCKKSREVTRKDILLIMELKNELANYYKQIPFVRGINGGTISDTDTLLSKVLLGTTACVPAFDRYFIAGLKENEMRASKFNESSLNQLFDFIELNKNEIIQCQLEIQEKINSHYPRMKILDIYFWQIGYDKEMEKKLNSN